MIAISPPYNTFRDVNMIIGGRVVSPQHRNFISDGALFQCLDCGRWSESLNVLNAVDCDEEANDGKTLEELKA